MKEPDQHQGENQDSDNYLAGPAPDYVGSAPIPEILNELIHE